MGLLILVDNARYSLELWLLLAAAMGLTFWECRERGYQLKPVLWWVTSLDSFLADSD